MLKTQRHATFERSDTDLLTKVKITLSEALLGFSRILLTHLDGKRFHRVSTTFFSKPYAGRGINVSSPPNKVIKPGQTIVVRNEGMPSFKRPDDVRLDHSLESLALICRSVETFTLCLK
jgi:DnaJ family protein A protein 2